MPRPGRIPWSIKVGLAGAALVGLGLVVYRAVRAPEIERIAEDRLLRDLSASAVALAAGITKEELSSPGLDARIKAAGREARVRFTVIAEDGTVVAESDVPDPRVLENHRDRPEVKEARENGSSRGRRVSVSVGRDLVYAAERIPGTQAVARAALDASDARALLGSE